MYFSSVLSNQIQSFHRMLKRVGDEMDVHDMVEKDLPPELLCEWIRRKTESDAQREKSSFLKLKG